MKLEDDKAMLLGMASRTRNKPYTIKYTYMKFYTSNTHLSADGFVSSGDSTHQNIRFTF